MVNNDHFIIDGKIFSSRLLMGTSLFQSLNELSGCIKKSGTQIVTTSVRRSSASTAQGMGGQGFWEVLKSQEVEILPNTAGCTSWKEAVQTAQLGRELFNTHWVKLEVIGNEYDLRPDPYESLKAAEALVELGFYVFPYMTEDLIWAKRLSELGVKVFMPWGSPIGSGRGIENERGLMRMREEFPETLLIVDAGIGRCSDAVRAFEIGFDGVLLNTAIAKALDPPLMAQSFLRASQAGRECYLAGIMEKRINASSSTTPLGKPFEVFKP